MRYTSIGRYRKKTIEKYEITEDEIFRKVMRNLVSEAPIELLQKVFSTTKYELNDLEVEFRVKIG